jgi:hypothetical protein
MESGSLHSQTKRGEGAPGMQRCKSEGTAVIEGTKMKVITLMNASNFPPDSKVRRARLAE